MTEPLRACNDVEPLQAGTLQVKLQQLWIKRRPKLLADVDLLCASLRECQHCRDTASVDPAIAFAEAEAHRLAGLLGCFGQGEASRLSAELERELESSEATGVTPDRLARAMELANAIRMSL